MALKFNKKYFLVVESISYLLKQKFLRYHYSVIYKKLHKHSHWGTQETLTVTQETLNWRYRSKDLAVFCQKNSIFPLEPIIYHHWGEYEIPGVHHQPCEFKGCIFPWPTFHLYMPAIPTIGVSTWTCTIQSTLYISYIFSSLSFPIAFTSKLLEAVCMNESARGCFASPNSPAEHTTLVQHF